MIPSLNLNPPPLQKSKSLLSTELNKEEVLIKTTEVIEEEEGAEAEEAATITTKGRDQILREVSRSSTSNMRRKVSRCST